MYTIIPPPNFGQPTKQQNCPNSRRESDSFFQSLTCSDLWERTERETGSESRRQPSSSLWNLAKKKFCLGSGSSLLTKRYPTVYVGTISLHWYALDHSDSWYPFTGMFSSFSKSAIFDGTSGCSCKPEAVPLHPWIPIDGPSELRELASPLSIFAVLIFQTQYGIPTPKSVAAKTPQEAFDAANNFGSFKNSWSVIIFP